MGYERLQFDVQLVEFVAQVEQHGDGAQAAEDAARPQRVADALLHLDDATLARIKTQLLADWYNGMESFLSRADTLAKLQLLWGDANVANEIPGWIDAVTSADVQRAARTYLTAANRTVIDRKPEAMIKAQAAAPQSKE